MANRGGGGELGVHQEVGEVGRGVGEVGFMVVEALVGH